MTIYKNCTKTAFIGFVLQVNFAMAANVIDVIPVTAISDKPILPKTELSVPKTPAALNIKLANDEYEPASFVLRANDSTLSSIDIIVSDLEGANGVLSAKNIDVRVVKAWYQGFTGWTNIGKTSPTDFRQTLVPELLLKDDSLVRVDNNKESNEVKLSGKYKVINTAKNSTVEIELPTNTAFPIQDSNTFVPLTLPIGENKQIWLTIYGDPAALPGTYTGTVKINQSSTTLASLPISVEILPFKLSDPKILYSVYYRGQLNPAKASIGSENKNDAQLTAELKNIKNHGVQSPTVYQLPNSPITNLTNILTLRDQLGMSKYPLFMANYSGSWFPATTSGLTQFKSAAKQVISLAKKYGIQDVYFYGKDEANGAELVKQKGFFDAAHSVGGKTFAAGLTGSFELIGTKTDIFVQSTRPSSVDAEKFHSVGNKIFSYANPQSGPENPCVFRQNFGVVLWAANYDGAMPYAYQHSFGAGWNDLDHKIYRDHNFTYPTVNGVIDTLAWEGFREAVDDVRYITTLEKMIDRAQTNNAAAADSALKAAKLFLTALKGTAVQSDGNKYTQNLKLDFEENRNLLISHIKALMPFQ
jgi:hypothetical protein